MAKRGTFAKIVKLTKKTHKYLSGYQVLFSKRIPRYLFIGLLGTILMYVGVAGIISVDAPWLVRGDTNLHVDYAWRLWHGDIPKRTDNIRYKPFVEKQGRPKPQAAAKNPPLFYAIHAPLIGPLLDAGHWQLGIELGRFLNILIGVLCILALSWGGWLFGGSRKSLVAVAVPALTVLIFRFSRLNVDYAVDVLLVLFTTLSMILSYKIIKFGPTKKYLSLITLVSLGGIFTKVSFVVFFASNLLAVFLSVYVRDKNKCFKKIIRPTLIAAAVLLVVVVCSGWFYYLHNYKTSGNLINAVPSDYHGPGRKIKSLSKVLTHSDLLRLLTSNYVRLTVVSLLVTGYSIAGILNTKLQDYQKLRKNKALFLGSVIVLLGFIGTFLTQVSHAVGTGSINFRYMLPALLPFGLFLAYGLLQPRWIKGQMVTLVAITMGLTSIGAFASTNKIFFGSGYTDYFVGGIFVAARANGVPPIITGSLLVCFGLGALLLPLAMFYLSAPKYESKRW